jgi:hypothetical protein
MMMNDTLVDLIIAAIIGALTFTFVAPAQVSQPAQRGEQIQLTEPPPPPDPSPFGLPFAPPELTGCDEMMFYLTQRGFPEQFRRIGWRESNCRNEPEVRTYCCHGYLQLYVSIHLKDHRLGPKYAECGVASHHDINDVDPVSKQRHACAARALYDVQGIAAWRATA